MKMLINGQRLQSTETFDVINPYTNKKIDSVPIATSEQILNALELSHQTVPTLTANQRARILEDVSKELLKRKDELAELITAESGLSLKDTCHEIERAAASAQYSSLMAQRVEADVTGDYILRSAGGQPELKVVTEPLDLIVAITPFNHPLNQVAHKVFPAIAAGACMVLKPSEKTPLSALRLGEILLEKGLEQNMLNIITGSPAEGIVDQILSSPLIEMVTFTGGLAVGLLIKEKMVASGHALTKYVPELGGCSSLIVNSDADLARSVKVALDGCFKNSGQRCTAVRRVIVVDDVAEAFLEGLVQEAGKVKYGDPLDRDTDVGTVISQEDAMRIEERVEGAIEEGAELKLGHARRGALYAPTILDRVKIHSELVAKETFGPVCPVIRAKDLDAAIDLANCTRYRLAGAVMTRSEAIARKVSNALKVGQFSWNGMPGYRTEAAPFGGFGDSGSGEKEGVVLATHGMRRIRTFYRHK